MKIPNDFRQFAIYCVVGSVNTGAGLAVVLVLQEWLHFNYIAANIWGYAVGLAISFFLHRKVTFPGRDKAARTDRQAGTFLAVFGFSYLVQLGVLVLLHKGGLPNWLCQTLALGVYVIVSFIGNKYLTFRSAKA